jgi:hypothetical protein
MADETLEHRCRACQERHADDSTRASKFSTEFPRCSCDQVSISPHSPGRVEDNEQLARLVLEPKHINPADGSIEVGALRDAYGNGLSLVRRKYVVDAELRKGGQALARIAQARENGAAKRDGRIPTTISLRGAVDFDTESVRTHLVDGNKRFCVMDSATPSDQFHADITVAAPKKSEHSRMRDELRKTLKNVIPYMPQP